MSPAVGRVVEGSVNCCWSYGWLSFLPHFPNSIFYAAVVYCWTRYEDVRAKLSKDELTSWKIVGLSCLGDPVMDVWWFSRRYEVGHCQMCLAPPRACLGV